MVCVFFPRRVGHVQIEMGDFAKIGLLYAIIGTRGG
jgi:hypothetical protein